MKNEKTLHANSAYAYTQLMKDMKKKPSLSRQFETFLSCKSEGNETEKRFFAAWHESTKANEVKFSDMAKGVEKRYINGLDTDEKFVSYYYFSQVCTKLLKKVLFNTENENLRNCIARYFRATLWNKVEGEKVVLFDSEKETTTTTETETK